MSMKELDRLDVLTRIAERRLTRRRAAVTLELSERHVRRLYRAFVRDGAAGLVSRRRGQPSARRLPTATRERALLLVRERYADFGPPSLTRSSLRSTASSCPSRPCAGG